MTGTADLTAVAVPRPIGASRTTDRSWAERPWKNSTALRLFITVWLVYAVHFATNIARETYLAITLGERLSIQVDEYLGLHPDLFEIPGRGVYINNNPGASMLGAVPYAVARPAISWVLSRQPSLTSAKPPADYVDPRPARERFLNEARARGLDVKLGLAGASMHLGLMAPVAALTAVLIFFYLLERLGSRRRALWLALLYAFGTPVFFRSAYLNQNALLTHFTLISYLALTWNARDEGGGIMARRLFWSGFALGFGLLCDYSALPLLVAFGSWLLYTGWRASGAGGALRHGALFTLGAAGPIALLFGYQWLAFGNPLTPAQAMMPSTGLSVRGWYGLSLPMPDLMWRNLFDVRYGLFAFCPMLMAALAAPWLRRRAGGPAGNELALIFAASIALFLFNSSVQFAYLQRIHGVRYMVPAVPLLFFALVPVLLRLPRWALWTIVLPTLVVSWSTAMARESVTLSLARIFLGGFELPWLTILHKTAAGYLPFLATTGVSAIPVLCLVGAMLWLIWRSPSSGSLPSELR